MGDGQHRVARGGAGFFFALLIFCAAAPATAEGGAQPVPPPSAEPPPLAAVLPKARWQQVESSVDHALAWLASQQAADGSFPSAPAGQPAVTSLCVMAFLPRGHQPGYGPYGGRIERAIDFVISCQRPDGLFSYAAPEAVHVSNGASHTASYNHAIAGLMLGEVYGHVTGERMKRVKGAISSALLFTRDLQLRPKRDYETGGWRYLRVAVGQADSDLSATAWQLMFLRSARNAEFDVPQAYIDSVMGFVSRCWNPGQGMFNYSLVSATAGRDPSRGTTGAGILALSLGGQHETAMAQGAGDWLLAHPFRGLGERVGTYDRAFYGMYYCSQAAMQLGGRYWQGIYPPIVEVLLGAQEAGGYWPRETGFGDAMFGSDYSTALAVLSLTPAYQLLPVYQR